jgi:cytochrome oxidase Cu insertion factor (SCO1/SenC/PrrC family)
MQDQKTKNRIILLTIFAIALVPLLVAIGMKVSGWRPARTTNYGQLIQPAKPLTDVELVRRTGEHLRLQDLRHRWLLVTFSKGACIGVCARSIYKMRQAHVAQGKYQERVRRMLVVLPNGAAPDFEPMVKAYPGMIVVTGPVTDEQALGRQLQIPGGTALDEQGWIYIVDPIGNYMMRYPPDADPNGIRKDLARLLRVSQVG